MLVDFCASRLLTVNGGSRPRKDQGQDTRTSSISNCLNQTSTMQLTEHSSDPGIKLSIFRPVRCFYSLTIRAIDSESV